MARRFLTLALLLLAELALAAPLPSQSAARRPLPRLRVSENRRFLVTEDGRPFFYLADTAWELFHRLSRAEVVRYLQLRAEQGYTAIQAVALGELEGLSDPNAHGDLPLIDKDPARPAVTPGSDPRSAAAYDYWDHVDFIVGEAEKRGLYVALLPTWGRWVVNPGGAGDVVFTEKNAEEYGRFIGKRYARHPIIWVLGGDRLTDSVEGVWRAMARGIALGATGRDGQAGLMMTFHPRGGGTSSTAFHHDDWLDFNMQQTGHGLAAETQSWARIAADYVKTPVKPVIDGEPLYEDHPLAFRAAQHGFSFDAHVRQRAYWNVFAGAAGHTYGNHAVWQMYASGRRPINGPQMSWQHAILRPGAAQMGLVRRLIESRPMLSRVPDQSLVVDSLSGADRVQATRGDGYLFVYSGSGRKFTVNMGRISGDRVAASWFNPRSGEVLSAGSHANAGTQQFTPPSEGFGADWVLVLDDAAKGFGAPGSR